MEERVTVKELEWADEESLNQLNAPFDYIVASDVVANCYSPTYMMFINVLDHCSDANTTFLMSMEKRSEQDLKFFQLLSAKFNWARVHFFNLKNLTNS